MATKILDFSSRRKKYIEEKRRLFERTLFDNFLGTKSVINHDGLLRYIRLVDISEGGLLFRLPWNPKTDKKILPGEEVNMKIYFTEWDYLTVAVFIRHAREETEEDGQTHVSYGCEFDKSLSSFDAMSKFIEFLRSFAEHSGNGRKRLKTA